QRRVHSRHRREDRAAHHIKIGDFVGHAVRIDYGCALVTSHSHATKIVVSAGPGQRRPGPGLLDAHLLEYLDAALADEPDQRELVWILLEGDADHRQSDAARVFHIRIEVEEVGVVHQALGLGLDRKIAIPIFYQVLLVTAAPTGHVGRQRVLGGEDGLGLLKDAHRRATDEAEPGVIEIVAEKIVDQYALR